jgi:hypothetical protein
MFYPDSHDKFCLTAKYSLLTGEGAIIEAAAIPGGGEVSQQQPAGGVL